MDVEDLDVFLEDVSEVLTLKNNMNSYFNSRRKRGFKIPPKARMFNLFKEISQRKDVLIIDNDESEDFIKKACIFIAYTIGTDDLYSDAIEEVYEKECDKYDSVIDSVDYKSASEVGFYNLFPAKKIDNCLKLYKILMYNDLVSREYLVDNRRAKPFEDVQRIVKSKNRKFYNYAIQSINKGVPSDYVKYFLGRKQDDIEDDEVIRLMLVQSGLREKSALNLIFTFANNLDTIKYLGIISVTDKHFTENYVYQIRTQSDSDNSFKASLEELKDSFGTISNASKECFGIDIGHAKTIEEICMTFHSNAQKNNKKLKSNQTIVQAQMIFTQIYGMSSQHEKISEDDLWVFITYVALMAELIKEEDKIDIIADEKDFISSFIVASGFMKMYQDSDNTLNSKDTHLYREQIAQLQCSNEELQANYIHMKDNKNDEINRLNNIIKGHTKEINKISMQHEKEVKKLNKKIDEYKKMKQELEALREFMQASNQEEQVVRFDMDKALEEINKRPVIMIGGFAKWVDKVREVIPNLKHLSADELGRSYNAIRDENAIVLFHAGYNNHGSYYKFINNINNGAKLIYLNTGSNIELLIKRIYDKLQ